MKKGKGISMLAAKQTNQIISICRGILYSTFCLITLISAAPSAFAVTPQDVTQNAEVKSSNAGLSSKLAPGEILPVSIKLANFGGGKRVDVLLHYDIYAETTNKNILSTNETVAVETTNNFIKNLQIPFDTEPGKYTVKASITYEGQKVPATTSFSFEVEPKILGVFRSTFYLYCGLAAVVGFLATLLIYTFIKRRTRSARSGVIEYTNVPKNQRVFYELVSDTVMNMRQQVGKEALEIAASIEGLEIDDTGRVIKLTGKPSRIVADLVAGYERSLGKRVSFTFRQKSPDKQSDDQ